MQAVSCRCYDSQLTTDNSLISNLYLHWPRSCRRDAPFVSQGDERLVENVDRGAGHTSADLPDARAAFVQDASRDERDDPSLDHAAYIHADRRMLRVHRRQTKPGMPPESDVGESLDGGHLVG